MKEITKHYIRSVNKIFSSHYELYLALIESNTSLKIIDFKFYMTMLAEKPVSVKYFEKNINYFTEHLKDQKQYIE